jgi:hypothetical protein
VHDPHRSPARSDMPTAMRDNRRIPFTPQHCG